MSYKHNNKYIELTTNGQLFPTWILANFKKYKLENIVKDIDPCTKQSKNELRNYQKFLSSFLDYNGLYTDMLIYHGLGSGKTASAINIYNMLYNYTPGWNVYLLIKAALKQATWITDLNKWLQEDEKEHRFKNIKFISYDAPNADKAFMEAVRTSDSSKKSLYIFDEAHNFIRNVYSNISSKHGKRALTIYDYIIQDKRENEGVRVLLLSGTPAINTPFELALMFNLLRPGIFPRNEAQFNQYYVSSSGYAVLNSAKKNNFQRRIMGLVSYYVGATPDYFASKTINYVDVEMSDYQEDIYTFFETIEKKMALKARHQTSNTTYKSYTRQACNFAFPTIGQSISGETRPRPKNFKMNEKELSDIDKGKKKSKDNTSTEKYYNVQNYLDTVKNFETSFDDYLLKKHKQDKEENYTIIDDIKKYKDIYKSNYNNFIKQESKKSNLLVALYTCSSKFLNMIFNILKSNGPVLVYSNYVLMEGLDIFKIYLKYFSFIEFTEDNLDKNKDNFRYTEFHGGIDDKQRKINIDRYNNIDNKTGEIIKIMLISPAGAEGLSLMNTRQVHITEPYWHETRIIQMIGRALRICSHKDLPQKDRHVDIYKYKSVRKNNGLWTTDQQIEDIARTKENVIQSFLDAMKEVAVDCELNKPHNSLVQDYKCFQFEEKNLFNEQIAPAYKDDIVDDMRIDNGSNAITSKTEKIKVIKISAVILLSKKENDTKILENKDDSLENKENSSENSDIVYSQETNYWYNPDTQVIYDYDLFYPVGKIAIDDDKIPIKYNNAYVIDKMIPIPIITN